METYKYNMAECCHAGEWQNDMFGRTCQDCGFNTLSNDYGMYGKVKQKWVDDMGLCFDNNFALKMHNEAKDSLRIGLFNITKAEGLPKGAIIVVGDLNTDPFEILRAKMKGSGYKAPEFLGPKQGFKLPTMEIKAEPILEEIQDVIQITYLDDTDPLKLDGTKQKKFRKGNNKKYFRRKRK